MSNAANFGTYVSLVDEHGEKEAKKIIADKLRKMADMVESDEYPYIYGYDEYSEYPLLGLNVTLSYPWGG